MYAEDPEQSKIKGKWNVTNLPVGGSNTKPVSSLNAGFALGVSTATENKDAARALVAFGASKETNLTMITTTGSGLDAIRKSTVNSEEYKEFAPKVQQVAKAGLNGAFAWPTGVHSPDLMQKLSDELALMLQGKKKPDAAVADMQAGWAEILGE